jgi:uncharacterized protein (DUF885 family)
MKRPFCGVLLCLSVFVCSGSQVVAQKSASAEQLAAPQSAWDRLVDQYFDDYYFPFHPTAGTSAGFHRYDTQLEDYSRAGIEAEIKSLKQVRGKIEAFNFPHGKVTLRLDVGETGKVLGVDVVTASDNYSREQAKQFVKTMHFEPAMKDGKPVRVLMKAEVDVWQGNRADRELLLHEIDGRLLELEQMRGWEKNPDRYASRITYSVFLIMSRKFAPPEERLRSVIARERLMPKVFEAAQANLSNPPKIYTQIALQQLPGIIRFFQQDVPSAFKEVKDRKLLDEFKQTNQAVIDSLSGYQKWLQDDLLPRSNGDFRIGAENYRRKLLYDEMVDAPLDELLKLGYADLRRNQQWLKETAARLDPNKTPEQVLAELQKNYPPPNQLLDTVRDVFGNLRGFIERAHIVTIPSTVLPIVEETPPFMRALTFASMDTPGPYEHTAKEAFFNVTIPEKDWTPERVREFMAQFNYDTLTAVAVHEAYPGHYVQFLWVQNAPSKVRKLVGSSSNAEGWAHYCEQMMLDEGYGRPADGHSDEKYLKLRLGQLQDALLRNARFIAGIEMHAGKMTFDQVIDFFVKEGYQSRAVAETEAKRGTSDPTYLVYTLGKLEILKLRADYQRKMGAKFSLQEFHDHFLQQGFPPVKVVRKAMLGDDSPVL